MCIYAFTRTPISLHFWGFYSVKMAINVLRQLKCFFIRFFFFPKKSEIRPAYFLMTILEAEKENKFEQQH